jgi:hypothetical protein
VGHYTWYLVPCNELSPAPAATATFTFGYVLLSLSFRQFVKQTLQAALTKFDQAIHCVTQLATRCLLFSCDFSCVDLMHSACRSMANRFSRPLLTIWQRVLLALEEFH